MQGASSPLEIQLVANMCRPSETGANSDRLLQDGDGWQAQGAVTRECPSTQGRNGHNSIYGLQGTTAARLSDINTQNSPGRVSQRPGNAA